MPVNKALLLESRSVYLFSFFVRWNRPRVELLTISSCFTESYHVEPCKAVCEKVGADLHVSCQMTLASGGIALGKLKGKKASCIIPVMIANSVDCIEAANRTVQRSFFQSQEVTVLHQIICLRKMCFQQERQSYNSWRN